jgi:hypothetical protein
MMPPAGLFVNWRRIEYARALRKKRRGVCPKVRRALLEKSLIVSEHRNCQVK